MATKDSASSAKKKDNLEAARIIRDTLEGFTQDEQQRILRWAGESLGIEAPISPALPLERSPLPSVVPQLAQIPPTSKVQKDIKTFVDEKNPQTDTQLAATIAYYYRFEAPEGERKDEIDASFLRDACRLAGRPGKLVKPLATLNNAHAKGFLDRGSARGMFAINSVGENLVGMTLGGAEEASRPRQRTKAPKRTK